MKAVFIGFGYIRQIQISIHQSSSARSKYASCETVKRPFEAYLRHNILEIILRDFTSQIRSKPIFRQNVGTLACNVLVIQLVVSHKTVVLICAKISTNNRGISKLLSIKLTTEMSLRTYKEVTIQTGINISNNTALQIPSDNQEYGSNPQKISRNTYKGKMNASIIAVIKCSGDETWTTFNDDFKVTMERKNAVQRPNQQSRRRRARARAYHELHRQKKKARETNKS